MAIPMPIVQDIRRLDRQGMSRAQIARRLHVDRGTVAKYADMEDCSPKPKADRRYGSKIDPYAHLVDEWLEADRLLPRKQRHTIRRVHDRLLAETDYDGEYSTTMRYVHRWREANRGVPDREGYVRLEWAAGSMQVDFGVARARIAGEMADVHCLVASLPYSNMRLCVALPGENAECLCHGLMLVFEHIGGVPPVIVMDNATGAGRRNAKGEVALTGVFSAFVAHYRLEVRFCNPYSGNEKGSVENAVGFLRRNLMVPPMHAESYGQLSRFMLERCDGLAASSYCPRLPDVPVTEVFDEEKAALMPLPSTEGRVDAVAVHGVRPGSLGKPDGRQVRAGRHRLEPVPRRPRFGAFQGAGRDPVGHGHARIARHRRALRGVSQTVRTVAQCGGSRARASPARGQTPRVAGKLDPPGRARRYTRVA